ncbi:DinB family protein [Candidatus Bathyarchaeota archaeon]|nr:DinB family protein [Candidatus Bathyarchaeota archaeon]
MRDTLVEYSDAVRGSTLKRLRSIPAGLENWKISENAMSIADIAQHLVDADNWLFEKMVNQELEPITGKAGAIVIGERGEYQAILDKLGETGKTRRNLIMAEDMDRIVFDSRFDGEVSALWIILRGNLDHETHHRGQLVAYIRALKDSGNL